MYITFQELFEFEEMRDAQVLAGKTALNNLIRWGHVIEVKNSKDWATPNMLVFTTGIAIEDDAENGLINMIENLNEKGASGLVLGLGFITDVPKKAVEFADEKEFPFIIIPGEVSFADVIFKIGNQIFEKMSSINRQHILIGNVLTETSTISYEAELEYYGYLRNVRYCVVAVRKEGKGRIENSIAEDLQFEVQKIRNTIHRKIFYYYKMNQLVFLIPDTHGTDTEISLESIIYGIDKYIETKLGKDNYYIAVSDWVNNSSDLNRAYRQTQTTFEKGRILSPEKRILSYRELGIFSLVDFSRKDELESIMKMSIGELYNHPDLIETLQVYICCSMNMQETADEMYVHVNTIKYRMKKIDQLLPDGLRKNRLYQIQTGIYLSKILSQKD